jgi:hypothetical protein
MQAAMDVIAATPLGGALYAVTTRGAPGAAIAPFDYPPFPGTPAPAA